MGFSDIPILTALRTRMQWDQERQRVLSENVANADTPNFRPRDLAPLPADRPLPAQIPGLALARTDPTHFAGQGLSASAFQTDRKAGYEIRPAGNAVVLEDEMMKVAANQLDYQTVTSLYGRSLALMKTALGRG